MAPRKAPAPRRTERVILLVAGESGSGKSFFVANLSNALIFDTDIGGGLAYLDDRIARNGSERVEAACYQDVLDEVKRRSRQMEGITTLAIDHLTTFQQEAVQRHNPTFAENTFGREHDRANKEWRKVRELARWGDFNLVCTAHLKGKYEKKELVGLVPDASKNVEADFTQVLYLTKGGYPATARVVKWRRDPEDPRGRVPPTFPFTLENFIALHGAPLGGERQEVAMASEGQVAELARLLAVVRLPEGTTEKWLAKAKAESWSELTAEQIGGCIKHLDGLLQKPGPHPVIEEEVA